MAQKILITGAQSALAYQLAWYLKTNDILFADTDNCENLIPPATSNSFAHQFLNYCLNHQIEVVFALKADEQQALNQSKILFAEFGIDLLIVDDSQLVNINASAFLDGEIKNLETINDFESFSAGVLKAGYPNQTVWFSRTDALGNIYEINDKAASVNFLWFKSTILSFTQVSKLINQIPFIPLFIYPAKEKITVCKVLLYKQQVFTYKNLNQGQLNIIDKLKNTFNLQGFLEITFVDDKLVRLKNEQL